MRIFLGVIIALIGILFLGSFIRGFRESRRLYREGIITTGIIFNKDRPVIIDWNRNIGKIQRKYYRVYYKFDENGYKDRHEVSEEFWDKVKIGDSIEIRYLPDEPDMNMIVGVPHHIPIPFSSLFYSALCIAVSWLLIVSSY